MVSLMSHPQPTSTWRPVVEVLRPEVDAPLADRFYSMLSLSEGELRRALRDYAEWEHGLDASARCGAVEARLRAWLGLGTEQARVLARAHDAALHDLPAWYEEQRRETELSVIMNGFRFGEFRELTRILPWLRDERGARFVLQALGDAGVAREAAAPPAERVVWESRPGRPLVGATP